MSTHNFTRVAMGVALATASLATLAQVPPANPAAAGAFDIISKELTQSTPPTLNRAEQTGLCLLESVMSLLATRTNDFGCGSASYSLDIETTDANGVGFADIDLGASNGGTTLNGVLGPTKDIGTRCNVTGGGQLKGLSITYDGAHGWSRTNEIFNSDAYIIIVDSQTGTPNYYREVDIKDYFKQVIGGRSWEFDWGLEDVKKRRTEAGWRGDTAGFYYPTQKWHEFSWYQHENGQEGGLWLKKYQVIPRSARGCRIEFAAHDLFNGSGEFQTSGTINVYRNPSIGF